MIVFRLSSMTTDTLKFQVHGETANFAFTVNHKNMCNSGADDDKEMKL